MRAGPRRRSEAQHIDTFVSFIQRGASRHRIKSLSRLRRSGTETVSTFFYIFFFPNLHVNQYSQRDGTFKLALAAHTCRMGFCNWHVITVICAFISKYNPIKLLLWEKYNQITPTQRGHQSFISFYQSKRFSPPLYIILASICSH